MSKIFNFTGPLYEFTGKKLNQYYKLITHEEIDDFVRHPSYGFEYILNEDNKSYSIKSVGSCSDTKVIIPCSYNGLPVTKISDCAFASYSSIKYVFIPITIVEIGRFAFANCSGLDTIIMSDNIATIKEGAFWNCASLVYISIPSNILTIGDGALYTTSLLKYDFSRCKTIPSIGDKSIGTNSSKKIIVPEALYSDWIKTGNWAKFAESYFTTSLV